MYSVYIYIYIFLGLCVVRVTTEILEVKNLKEVKVNFIFIFLLISIFSLFDWIYFFFPLGNYLKIEKRKESN